MVGVANEYGILEGTKPCIIEDGTIEGGTIEGGTIEGGIIEDGTIEGGTIEDGTIEGGIIEDGTIEGGTIVYIEGGHIEPVVGIITGVSCPCVSVVIYCHGNPW